MTGHDCDLVDAYLDNELGTDERLEFERHLKGCEACKKALAEGLALRTVLASGGEVPLRTDSPELWQRIEPQLGERKAGLGSVGWLVGAAMLGTALIGQAALFEITALETAQYVGLPVRSWLDSVGELARQKTSFGGLAERAPVVSPVPAVAAVARELTDALEQCAAGAERFGGAVSDLGPQVARALPPDNSFDTSWIAESADVLVVSAFGLGSWLLLTCLALSFFGWTLAARRQRTGANVARVRSAR